MRLIAVAIALEEVPSFAIPVFSDDNGKTVFAQSFGEDEREDTIISFVEMDANYEGLIKIDDEKNLNVGEKGVLGFYWGLETNPRAICCSRDELKQILRDKIHLFDEFHFVRCDIANFLGDKAMEEEAKTKAIDKLRKEYPDYPHDFANTFPR